MCWAGDWSHQAVAAVPGATAAVVTGASPHRAHSGGRQRALGAVGEERSDWAATNVTREQRAYQEAPARPGAGRPAGHSSAPAAPPGSALALAAPAPGRAVGDELLPQGRWKQIDIVGYQALPSASSPGEAVLGLFTLLQPFCFSCRCYWGEGPKISLEAFPFVLNELKATSLPFCIPLEGCEGRGGRLTAR